MKFILCRRFNIFSASFTPDSALKSSSYVAKYFLTDVFHSLYFFLSPLKFEGRCAKVTFSDPDLQDPLDDGLASPPPAIIGSIISLLQVRRIAGATTGVGTTFRGSIPKGCISTCFWL